MFQNWGIEITYLGILAENARQSYLGKRPIHASRPVFQCFKFDYGLVQSTLAIIYWISNTLQNHDNVIVIQIENANQFQISIQVLRSAYLCSRDLLFA